MRSRIEDYTRVIERQPHHANAYLNRGEAERKIGDRQKALGDLTTAADLYETTGKSSQSGKNSHRSPDSQSTSTERSTRRKPL